MSKRKVTIEVTRYYSKTSKVEVSVDDDLIGDALVDYLTDDEDLDNDLENALGDACLVGENTTYEWQDPTNGVGGTL
jgi:hypothetical protein